MSDICHAQKGECHFPFERGVEAKLLPWQYQIMYYFMSFSSYITVAKFEENFIAIFPAIFLIL